MYIYIFRQKCSLEYYKRRRKTKSNKKQNKRNYYIQTSLYYKGCKAFSTPSSQQLQVHKLLANLRAPLKMTKLIFVFFFDY